MEIDRQHTSKNLGESLSLR